MVPLNTKQVLLVTVSKNVKWYRTVCCNGALCRKRHRVGSVVSRDRVPRGDH